MALLDRCDGHYIVTPQIICIIVVLKVLKLDQLDLVQTLLPNTVELTVLEMLEKVRTATLTLVQVRHTMFIKLICLN